MLENKLEELIEEGFSGTQADFRKALRKHGLDVNQSTISRALKRIGASKQDGSWQLPENDKFVRPQNHADHVLGVTRNETMIVIKTLPGSANFIGSYLDTEGNSEVLGTLAGDDCVFVVPRSVNRIRKCMALVCDDIGVEHA